LISSISASLVIAASSSTRQCSLAQHSYRATTYVLLRLLGSLPLTEKPDR
jgi:hypothetical protein